MIHTQCRAACFALAALLGFFGAAATATEEPISATFIVPGVRVGPVTSATSEADLRAIHGAAEVQATEIPVGEGMTEPGTVLFPGDPRRTLEIIWRDASRTRAREIRIRNEGTVWRTKEGLTIGTTLREIERQNGGAFVLAGFGWDYGGTVLHAAGGRLGELGREAKGGLAGRLLLLRLAPASEAQSTDAYAAVTGDGAFSSNHPSMQALDPAVYEIVVTFAARFQ